jgi:hypothetical protein
MSTKYEDTIIHGPVPLNPSTEVFATDEICRHGRCGKPARVFRVIDCDTHDSPDMSELSGFCSVECFICELTHTGFLHWDEVREFLRSAIRY